MLQFQLNDSWSELCLCPEHTDCASNQNGVSCSPPATPPCKSVLYAKPFRSQYEYTWRRRSLHNKLEKWVCGKGNMIIAHSMRFYLNFYWICFQLNLMLMVHKNRKRQRIIWDENLEACVQEEIFLTPICAFTFTNQFNNFTARQNVAATILNRQQSAKLAPSLFDRAHCVRCVLIHV